MRPTLKTQPFTRQPNESQRTVELEIFRAQLIAFARDVGEIAMLGGVLHEAVAITSGTLKSVAHGLGKLPSGWIVTRSGGSSASLYEVSRTTTHLNLMPGNTGTVDIWIY
jgi:hypothetical protein